ncbi:MAG: prolyl oligopeptidase family serine peptidase [Pseudomonadota bacterium]
MAKLGPWTAIAAAPAFAACSSGGGNDTPPPPRQNVAPTVSISAPSSATEAATVTLSAAESRDPDGSIATFTWRQTDGPAARLTGDLTAEVSVQAPLVPQASDLTFQVTATDNEGASTTASVVLTVDPAPRPSILEFVTVFDGRERAYTVYTPQTFVADQPAVMVLHGGNGNMRDVFEPARPTQRWIELADQDGLLIISPNGYSEVRQDGLGEEQSWADIRDDQSGLISMQDDEGFLLQVLDVVREGRGHDPQRVLVTGSSNGGMMTFRMLVNQGDRFAAGASFIGGMPEQFVPLPPTATPVMILAGTDDPLVLFEGGIVAGRSAPTRSIPDTVEYWLDASLADRSTQVTTTLPDTTDDDCLIDETTWTTASGTPAVSYYQMNGGGHIAPDTTPSLRAPFFFDRLGNQCSDAHGIDLAYAFFRSVP